jgi:hypothetical protein
MASAGITGAAQAAVASALHNGQRRTTGRHEAAATVGERHGDEEDFSVAVGCSPCADKP